MYWKGKRCWSEPRWLQKASTLDFDIASFLSDFFGIPKSSYLQARKENKITDSLSVLTLFFWQVTAKRPNKISNIGYSKQSKFVKYINPLQWKIVKIPLKKKSWKDIEWLKLFTKREINVKLILFRSWIWIIISMHKKSLCKCSEFIQLTGDTFLTVWNTAKFGKLQFLFSSLISYFRYMNKNVTMNGNGTAAVSGVSHSLINPL